MNIKKAIYTTILLASILTGCKGESERVVGDFKGPGAPSGSDAISASTNRSSKESETSPDLNPFSGAAFIKPPQINNYGSVSLGYEIETLPGRSGIGPQVGLSYSSSAGDGTLGMGWNIATGLGVISRATKYGQLYYDNRDEFTFNGKRLIKVEGSDSDENGTYRLEIESGFSKFVLRDAEMGGIWTLYDKSGNITTFGQTKDSRIYKSEEENKTYTWNFSKIIDLSSNYMEAVYDRSEYKEKNILYLKEIKYTGNLDAGYSPKKFIRFEYKNRDENYVSKSAGFLMIMDKILSRISIGYDDTELWHYEFIYENSYDSGRPLLKTIRSDRNSTAAEFSYKKDRHYLTWEMPQNPYHLDDEISSQKTKYFEGDFNGDGLSDMLFFNPENGMWKAAEKNLRGGYSPKEYGEAFKGYDSEEKIQFFKGNVSGDYNGDGRSDIAFYLPQTKTFMVAEHNGKTFNFVNYGKLDVPVDIFACEWFPGDYDGNGLSDAILFDEPTGNWILMRNLGGKFDFRIFANKFKNIFRNDYESTGSTLTGDNSLKGEDRHRVHFLNGDYNGDGRTDISIYDEREGKWIVGESYRDPENHITLNWKLYKEFKAPEKTLFGFDRFSGDFNGDGYSDFLLYDRENGRWIIGETGNGTIDFRIFGETPEFKEITRWLQGDFNGDGRTDIGFYNSLDHKFWIGEATKDGFRYRVYNQPTYGGTVDRLLSATPLPEDEVTIDRDYAVVTGSDKTEVITYEYNSNSRNGNGEDVFAGKFKDNSTGLLIYKRKDKTLYYKEKDKDLIDLKLSLDFDENSTFLFDGQIDNYEKGNGIIYYRTNKDITGSAKHSFNLIYNDVVFKSEPVAEFTDDEVIDFDLNKSILLKGKFNSAFNDLIVLNDKPQSPFFHLLNSSGNIKLEITGLIDESFFTNIRENKNIIFLSGSFNGSKDKVIICDRAGGNWYEGSIDINTKTINFSKLNSSVNIESTFTGDYYFTPSGELVYSTNSNGLIAFFNIWMEGSALSKTGSGSLEMGYTYRGLYDNNYNPVVRKSSELKRVTFEGSQNLQEFTDSEKSEIKREDLVKEFYPLRWIQGDYNGDSKTDIGLFNFKEPRWYFAVTGGVTPDLLNEVKNGIGGTYYIKYKNSSTFDNTGEDDIPDLPMNYKVCSELTVEDGQGSRVTTYYDYEAGYAFSGYINDKKETDYFGFGKFTVSDAYGAKSVSYYNNMPYEDFRKNRALAGAVKRTETIGTDGIVYSRTDYEYKLHEIKPYGFTEAASFIVVPEKVKNYSYNETTKTLDAVSEKQSILDLDKSKYELSSKKEILTDFYQDNLYYKPVTITTVIENYDNISETNEMRLSEKINLPGSENQTTQTFVYDAKGNVVEEKVSYTGTGLLKPADMIKEYIHDSFGNRVESINKSSTPHRKSKTIYETTFNQFVEEEQTLYDKGYLYNSYKIDFSKAFGQVTEKEDTNGNKTYFEYDEYGRLKAQFADTDEGKEQFTEYSYDTDFPLSVKFVQYTGTEDQNNETRVFADGAGRVIHSVSKVSNGKYVKSGKLVYDNAGRLIRKSQTGFADSGEINFFKANSKEKYPTETRYDAAGRVKFIISPKAENEEELTYISYNYETPFQILTSHSSKKNAKRIVRNARGHVLFVNDMGEGDNGEISNVFIGFVYDLAGNRIRKFDGSRSSLDSSTKVKINPPLSSRHLPLKKVENLKASRLLDSNLFKMDESLFTIGAKDSSGYNICQWKYDGFGRVTESSDADFGFSRAEYNGFGELVKSTDANNLTTRYEYDSLGRIVSKIQPGDDGTVVYYYDGGFGADNPIGRVVKIEDSNQVKIFNYDKLGRIKSEKRIITEEGGEFDTEFSYDLLNRHKYIKYPEDPKTGNSLKLYYSYVPEGVFSVKTDSKDIVSSTSYNKFGQMLDVKRGNGSFTSYKYDIKGRLLNLKTISEGKLVQDVKYTFNLDNSIREVSNSPEYTPEGAFNGDISFSYEYDGLNRLKNAVGNYIVGNSSGRSFERNYSYTDCGNLIDRTFKRRGDFKVDDSWKYSYSNHAVRNITDKNNKTIYRMEYDNVGNMTSQVDSIKNLTKKMEYDSNNRIKQVFDKKNSLVARYDYDDQGFRVRKFAQSEGEITNGSAITFTEVLYPSMYFGMEKKRTEGGAVVPDSEYAVNNIYINGVRIAAITPEGSARYYLTDQVDSVKVVLDDAGEPVKFFEYFPYGDTWLENGKSSDSPKFNSQELDKETSFYFYNARHYDPVVARFVTADSVIDGETTVQGWNRYMYCHGNPVIYRDPTGHNIFSTFSQNLRDEDSETKLRKALDRLEKFAIAEVEKNSKQNLQKEKNSKTKILTAGAAIALAPDKKVGAGAVLVGAAVASIAVLADKINGDSLLNSKLDRNMQMVKTIETFMEAAKTADADSTERKMLVEIYNIASKEKYKKKKGWQYSLRAVKDGKYEDVRKGSKNLKAGDIWKYGETTNLEYPENRYGQSWLRKKKLAMAREFRGTQMQIKILEKAKIYHYYLQKGELPPGNRIFR